MSLVLVEGLQQVGFLVMEYGQELLGLLPEASKARQMLEKKLFVRPLLVVAAHSFIQDACREWKVGHVAY